jgi:hypothetical protein
LRALRVFRDKTSLSANPALWSAIEQALTQSEYFLLMASPYAAGSQWVQNEVDWWLTHRSLDKLLVVVTEGDIRWDTVAKDFDPARTTCLPATLV